MDQSSSMAELSHQSAWRTAASASRSRDSHEAAESRGLVAMVRRAAVARRQAAVERRQAALLFRHESLFSRALRIIRRS